MEVTEVTLKNPEDGQSYLEANKGVLETRAIQSLMSLMESPSQTIKLDATIQALKTLGKSEHAPAAQAPGTFIQINQQLMGKTTEALAGIVKAVSMMPGAGGGALVEAERTEGNAPQTSREAT